MSNLHTMGSSRNRTGRISRAIATVLAALAILAAMAGCSRSSANTSASARIGDKGGIVRLADGAAVVVPPQAFTSDASIRMERVSADQAHGGTPDGWTPAGPRYEITLGETKPRVPVRVELPVDSAHNISDGSTFLAYFDEQRHMWVPAGGEPNTTRQPTLGTETSHASWWSVFTQTSAGDPIWGADRSIVYLPSASSSLRLCPYVSALPTNPCYSSASDKELDPINVVFYGLSNADIEAGFRAAASRWVEPPECQTIMTHSAYTGADPMVEHPSLAQAYESRVDRDLGGCVNVLVPQYHVRIFRIDANWTLAAAHYEWIVGGDNPLPVHQPIGAWEEAEQQVEAQFIAAGDRVEPHRLLLQRDCARGCTFRGQFNDGWATLITKPDALPAIPSMTFDHAAAPVGAQVQVSLAGFPPNTNVILYGDAGRVNLWLSTHHIGPDGKATFQELVPFTYNSPYYGAGPVPPGTYTVRAEVASDDTVFAERNFDVMAGNGSTTSPPPGPVSGPGSIAPGGPVSPPGGPGRPPAFTPVPWPSPVSPPGRPAPPTPVSPPAFTPVPWPSPVSPPGGISSCPPVYSGHWHGTWHSDTGPYTGTWDLDASVTSTGQFQGQVFFNGMVSPSGGSVVGTVSCAHIDFGDPTGLGTRFSGTLSADGRSASGNYTTSADRGTWSGALR